MLDNHPKFEPLRAAIDGMDNSVDLLTQAKHARMAIKALAELVAQQQITIDELRIVIMARTLGIVPPPIL